MSSAAFQSDLFGERYPRAPGWKARRTAADAAAGIAAKAKPLRERVLEEIGLKPGTPEQIAHRLGVPLMNVRPRCSELAALKLIVDSGGRATAMGGRQAIIWRIATP
jgi:hypothetical protein